METAGRGQEKLSLPRATMIRVMDEMLPSDMTIDKDAQELLMESSTVSAVSLVLDDPQVLPHAGFAVSFPEFIRLITSQANEIRDRGEGQVVRPEHVIKALEELEFGEYKQKVEKTYEEHETLRLAKASAKKKARRGDVSGMTEEEALATQQRMFAEAKASMYSRRGAPQQPRNDGNVEGSDE